MCYFVKLFTVIFVNVAFGGVMYMMVICIIEQHG